MSVSKLRVAARPAERFQSADLRSATLGLELCYGAAHCDGKAWAGAQRVYPPVGADGRADY